MGRILSVSHHFLSHAQYARYHAKCTDGLVFLTPSSAHPLQDIESDLVSGTKDTVSFVMQRLLHTLTYDRKISYVDAIFFRLPP